MGVTEASGGSDVASVLLLWVAAAVLVPLLMVRSRYGEASCDDYTAQARLAWEESRRDFCEALEPHERPRGERLCARADALFFRHLQLQPAGPAQRVRLARFMAEFQRLTRAGDLERLERLLDEVSQNQGRKVSLHRLNSQ